MSPEQFARALAKLSPAATSPLETLDDRELEVFSALSQGYSSNQIESQFGIARAELEPLKKRIQVKLGLRSEAKLIQAAARYAARGQVE